MAGALAWPQETVLQIGEEPFPMLMVEGENILVLIRLLLNLPDLLRYLLEAVLVAIVLVLKVCA